MEKAISINIGYEKEIRKLDGFKIKIRKRKCILKEIYH